MSGAGAMAGYCAGELAGFGAAPQGVCVVVQLDVYKCSTERKLFNFYSANFCALAPGWGGIGIETVSGES